MPPCAAVVLSTVVLFALLFDSSAAAAAASSIDCGLQGTYKSGDASVAVGGTQVTFTAIADSQLLANYSGPVSATLTAAGVNTDAGDWFHLQLESIGCSCMAIRDGRLTLMEPESSCGSEYYNTTGAVFVGQVDSSSQPFCQLWILGVLGALLGTFLSTLGLGLQKLTHEKLKAAGRTNENYCKHPAWLLGLGCLVVDAILDVWTFGLAPASLLAPLASMVLVWNTITAPCLVGERLTKRGLLGTATIIAGSICATAYSQHSTPSYTQEDFDRRWRSPEVIIYEVIVLLTFTGGQLTLRYVRKKAQEGFDELVETSIDSSGVVLEGEEVDAAAPDADLDDAMTLHLQEGTRLYNIAQFVYAMLAGLLGGQSIMFAKTVVELLKTTFFGPDGSFVYNAFASWQFYLFLLALATILVTQTQVLNMALHNFDALNVIPIFITFYQVFGIFGGAIYYEEFASFGVEQAVLFPVGCCISFCGIIVLSRAPSAPVPSSEKASGDNSPAAGQTPTLTTSKADEEDRRERYRTRLASAVTGPMLGFLAAPKVSAPEGGSMKPARRQRQSIIADRVRRASSAPVQSGGLAVQLASEFGQASDGGGSKSESATAQMLA